MAFGKASKNSQPTPENPETANTDEAPPIFRWIEGEGELLTADEVTALDADGPEWRETVEDGVVDAIWQEIAGRKLDAAPSADDPQAVTPEPVTETPEPVTPDVEQPADVYAMMMRGSKGAPVVKLQKALNSFYPGLPALDTTYEEYDAATEDRVRYFQRKHGHDVDGVAGPRVASALGLI